MWAECGGLMYLASTLVVKDRRYPMVGALPIVVEQTTRLQGHGYVSATVDADNPFFPAGMALRGHEFHYSRVVKFAGDVTTALSLDRGTGIGDCRDGIVCGRVFASYMHIFAPGTPEWAKAFLRVVRETSLRPINPIPIGVNCGSDNSGRRAD